MANALKDLNLFQMKGLGRQPFCNQCYGNQCFVRFTIDFYDVPPFCKPCHMTKLENAKLQHWAFITLNKRSVNVHSLTLYCISMAVISIL